jgi:hypothetical protein
MWRRSSYTHVLHARNPYGHFAIEVGVRPRLGHAQSDLSNQLALILRKWLQFDEQCVGHRGRAGEPDTRPASGARVSVDHVNYFDVGIQYLAEPRGREFADLGGDRQRVHEPTIIRRAMR